MRKSRQRGTRTNGFSLLELMVSLAVFLIVAGAVMSSLVSAQKNYRSSEVRTSLQQAMRSAMELMAQEVGQAGLQPSGVDAAGLGAPLATVLPSACTGSPPLCISPGTNIPVQVTSVAGIYPGQWLWVDAGPGLNCYPSSYCEHVRINSIDPGPPARIFADFGHSHYAQTINGTMHPTPFYGMGAYPQGVVPEGLTPKGGSTSSQLEIFGDITGAGNSLLAVIYACPEDYPGAFTRTVYDATTGGQISSSNLLSNVTACQFTYTTKVPAFLGTTVVTSVGISLTAQSETKDPQTGKLVTLTKSFLNIQPRNIISALNQVASCATNENTCNQANELQTVLPENLP